MKKTFTKEYFLIHKGCYSGKKMKNLVDNNKYATIQHFLDWDISIKDKFYFIRNYCELTIRQKQFLALMCAKVSLKIYEAKYPNDKRVSNCIDATEGFLNGTVTKEILLQKKAAAYTAADAAYAAAYADAAYADAYAAYAAAYAAAYVAAYAAAYVAAYADADAAYAAAYADADAAYVDADAAYVESGVNHTKNFLDALKQFCKEQE